MDPRHLFFDDRLKDERCIYCQRAAETRDHVPSRVFLDTPYPAEMPTVPACEECNSSYSMDETYLACFLECVACGTTDPAQMRRDTIGRTLSRSPKLRERLDSSRINQATGQILWQPEHERANRVIAKLAAGHAAYELWPQQTMPSSVVLTPLHLLEPMARSQFLNSRTQNALWPELGTRAFHRSVRGSRNTMDGWVVVQQGRYQYLVEDRGSVIRILLGDYLACKAVWGDEVH